MPKNLSVVLSFTGACEESIAGVDYWITRIFSGARRLVQVGKKL